MDIQLAKNKEKDTTKDDLDIGSFWSNFTQETTVHGFNKLATSRTRTYVCYHYISIYLYLITEICSVATINVKLPLT